MSNNEREESLHHTRWLDGIFQLRGLGKKLWRGEDPDEYVLNLRQGWNEEDLHRHQSIFLLFRR